MKEEIDWLLSAYGFVIPWNRDVRGEVFAEEIKRNFCLENPHNKYAYNLALNLKGRFLYSFAGFKYSE